MVLLRDTLSQLRTLPAGDSMWVPRYDKSAHAGQVSPTLTPALTLTLTFNPNPNPNPSPNPNPNPNPSPGPNSNPNPRVTRHGSAETRGLHAKTTHWGEEGHIQERLETAFRCRSCSPRCSS